MITFQFAVLLILSYFMILLIKIFDAEVGWLWVQSSFNDFSGVLSESCVITDDVIWLLSREELAADTFVFC